jgi:hypothetical protein
MNPLAGPAGPGKYSTRTDNLQMGSIAYGEGKDTAAIQSGAPLATTPDVRPSQAPSVSPMPSGTGAGLYDPTQRPDEPITSGVDIGPGVGSSALMMQSKFAQDKLSNTLAQMLPYDQTGEIGILYQNALARGM